MKQNSRKNSKQTESIVNKTLMLEKLTMFKTSVFKSLTSVNVKELFIEPRKY